MSLSVPAVELVPDVNLFSVVERLNRLFHKHYLDLNSDEMLSSVIPVFDRGVYNGSIDDTFRRYLTLNRSGLLKNYSYALTFPKFDFVSLEGRVFVLSSAVFHGETLVKVLNDEVLSAYVIQDYSFFNATDSQIHEGGLPYDEWRGRSDFWHNHYSTLRKPFLSYSLLDPFEEDPSASVLLDRLDEICGVKFDDEWRRSMLVKALAQEVLISDFRAGKVKDSEGNFINPDSAGASTLIWLMSDLENRGIDFEKIEASIPELVSLI